MPHASESSLAGLARALRTGTGVLLKQMIGRVAAELPPPALHGSFVRNGDDAAAIPDGDGYVLLAAEGLIPSFLRADPWFAGFCSIMVNVSDIAAMGGRALAVVDVLWQGDDIDPSALFAGMREASRVFGVPIVGGHTGRAEVSSSLAVAIVGRAKRLITSFDARPGQAVVLAVDLRGRMRGAGSFDAATGASGEALRAQLALLPSLAERGWVNAGKDVSMGGIVGTLIMLCEGSGCGATIDLAAIPCPMQLPRPVWLQAFPSFGFILAVDPARVPAIAAEFEVLGVVCAAIGRFEPGGAVAIEEAGDRATVWDLASTPLTGFGVHPERARCL